MTVPGINGQEKPLGSARIAGPAGAIAYRVLHTTTYRYSEPVALSQNELHLAPRETPRQSCLAARLEIRPKAGKLDEACDYFGNRIHFFSLDNRHQELAITSEARVRIAPAVYWEPKHSPSWEQVRDSLSCPGDTEALAAAQFAWESPHVSLCDELAQYARESFAPARPWLEGVLELTARIHAEFAYDPTATDVTTPLEAVLAMRRGVCQDFAHLQIGCLRALGLPARYVSGYLLTAPPPGQPRLVGADASHAWLSAWCPTLGWIEFDPTNNLVPSLDHITVAWGRDYSDVCPIKGVFVGGGGHTMSVSVDVQPVDEIA